MSTEAKADPVRALIEAWRDGARNMRNDGDDCGDGMHLRFAKVADAFADELEAALAQQAGAEPTCPATDCGARVLYECPACSHHNYPPRAGAPQPAIPEVDWLTSRGNDPRVEVDSYAVAIEAALIYIGAERPGDDEPEEQWFWDKLTALLEIAQHNQESAR